MGEEIAEIEHGGCCAAPLAEPFHAFAGERHRRGVDGGGLQVDMEEEAIELEHRSAIGP